MRLIGLLLLNMALDAWEGAFEFLWSYIISKKNRKIFIKIIV